MIQRFRQYLIDSYNGLYKIVLEPSMPTRQTVILLIVGILIGMLCAYVLYPVVFYDANPHQLSGVYRDQWVKLVAASYNGGSSSQYDAETVKALLALVEQPGDTVARLVSGTQGVEQRNLQAIQALATEVNPGRAAPRDAGIIASLLSFLVPIIVVTVVTPVLVLIWRLLFYPNVVAPLVDRLRPKSEEEIQKRKELEAERARRLQEIEMQKHLVTAVDEQLGQPLIQKLSIYTRGHIFDDSFAIEDANDMFLGECGSSKSKTIGDTNELTAVEIWLFDKEDFVRTLTKVFCSEYAFNDPAIRSELETKVENPDTDLVVVKEGASLVLDTNALRVQATIKSFAYGSGALPPNSFFENLNVQIAAWQKAGRTATAPAPAGAPAMQAVPTPAPVFSPPPRQAAPPAPSFAPPPTAPSLRPTQPPAPGVPAASPGLRPLSPPPLQGQPQTPPRRPPEDDDPFGGTGDFTPLGNP